MKIGVITTTRAEYGLLKGFMQKVSDDPDTELCLIVTGTHLLPEYGYTVKYIEEDGFSIAERVRVEINASSSEEISKTMGRYFIAFSGVFERLKPDFLVVLGDRYEMIPICYCAANAHIPIAHISGGEVTEGAIDDAVRHCLTKLSFLHFPACEVYRKRIIQLGESPDRVFNVGDPGVENIKTTQFLTEKELRTALNLKNMPYFSVIFHPTTLETTSPTKQIEALLKAIDYFPNIQFVIMKSNADAGGEQINKQIEDYAESHDNCVLFSSLKIEEFLSLQCYSLGLIGNSSSGIVETPCFGLPTVNIGDRQRGRLCADSIISCGTSEKEIVAAIKLSLTDAFRERAKNALNPYGFGNTSAEILMHIKSFIKENKVNLKKKFYDIDKVM